MAPRLAGRPSERFQEARNDERKPQKALLPLGRSMPRSAAATAASAAAVAAVLPPSPSQGATWQPLHIQMRVCAVCGDINN